ncbi:protein of unknown function [Paenibacillus sophorae]|uniref:DUF4349 domain-containing protein n=1 Tax=Paenibacillus sophorae TaxID=1333845 RepID=A0A1H8N281_9BACL|nr:DUF4349 domain-containing protein [Paenibacillus sophorae]QWU14819.1 DUF4349 domain-containing protein [Paenibacillus sophorae]SEO23690.1 protein of unknown function [Paenibacillus sophorae]
MFKRSMYYMVTVMVLLCVMLAGCSSGGSAGSADKAANSAMSKSVSFQSNVVTEGAPAAAALADSAETAQKSGSGSGKDFASFSAAEETVSSSGGFTAGDVAAGLNKKLIYHANLNMEVENYEKAQTEVRNRINLARGYILGFTETMSDSEHGGTFVVKVPASGFSSFLDSLEKIKNESLQRSIEGQDVSEEYVDLEARLKAKQLLETQYVEFMKKATKATDLVSFANELGKVQEEIEQIKGRMRYIDQNVLYSTVELRLYQPDESTLNLRKEEPQSLFGRASDALRGTLNALSMGLDWLIIVLAGALPILIGAGLILAVLLWFRRSRRRRREEASLLIREANRSKEEDAYRTAGQSKSRTDGEDKPGDAPQALEPPEDK